MKIKLIIIIGAILIFFSTINAQVSGVAGRKAVIKTDIVNIVGERGLL